MNTTELATLADAYADGTIDAAGLHALQEALRSDPGLRRDYLRIMRGHHQIRAVLQAASGQADAPHRSAWSGPLLAAAILAVAAGLAALVLRPDPLRIAAVQGALSQEISGREVPIAIGDRAMPGARIRSGSDASIRLASRGAAFELAASSDLTITPDGGLRLIDGAAEATGEIPLDLGGARLSLQGEAGFQAAPWAVLLRLDRGELSGLPGLRAGGWARRPVGAEWSVHGPETIEAVGEARIVARYLAHYRTHRRFVLEDAVASGPPRWSPDAAEFLARAGRLGGMVDGLVAEGDAIVFPAAGQDDLQRKLMIGRLVGGLSLRMQHRFRMDRQRPMAEDGRPGNGFDLSFGATADAPFPGAPAMRVSPPSNVQGEDRLSELELRILPIGRSGDEELSEIGVWADGRLYLCGWLRGPVLSIGTAHRGGGMRLSGIRIAELWDTLAPQP
jgi:hypothetical protein